MRSYRLVVFLGLLFAVGFAFTGSPALAATPSFTITATNVTVSSSTSSGVGSSTFTLTSVNGYTGTIRVSCNLPTPLTGVKVPYCGYGTPESSAGTPAPPDNTLTATPGSAAATPAPPSITLTANEVVTGILPFFNSVVPSCTDVCPADLQRPHSHRLAQGLALAGALLLGFGLRRRAAGWLTLTVLAVGALAGLAGISACGGNNNAVTPGTYVYTISATELSTAVTVTTSVNVTVP